MTITQQWNGLPPEPEKTGVHLFHDPEFKNTWGMNWSPGNRYWFNFGRSKSIEPEEMVALGWQYLGPAVIGPGWRADREQVVQHVRNNLCDAMTADIIESLPPPDSATILTSNIKLDRECIKCGTKWCEKSKGIDCPNCERSDDRYLAGRKDERAEIVAKLRLWDEEAWSDLADAIEALPMNGIESSPTNCSQNQSGIKAAPLAPFEALANRFYSEGRRKSAGELRAVIEKARRSDG